MFRTVCVIPLLIIFSVANLTSGAEIIRMSGTITQVNNQTGLFSTDIAAGMAWTGTYEFDRNAFGPDQEADPNFAVFNSLNSVGAARMQLSFGNFEIVGDDDLDAGFSDRTQIALFDDFIDFDAFSSYFLNEDMMGFGGAFGGLDLSTYSQVDLEMFFDDVSESAIMNETIPTAQTLANGANWDDRGISFRGIQLGPFVEDSIFFRIDSVSAIPEPTTTGALLILACVVQMRRSRQSSKPRPE